MNCLHAPLSVTRGGGLLLVAKFSRVCCPSSSVVSRKDRSGDVRAVVERMRTAQPETAVVLLLFC